MAHVAADRVQETTTTVGTGTVTLAGAVAGFKTFASRMAVADTCWYAIVDPATGAWETGLGTLASATTLTRTTVVESSNADLAVSFAAGTKNIFLTAIADKTVILNAENAILLPALVTNPATPIADMMLLYARKIAGRIMPKWTPPSGVDAVVQPSLFGNRIVTYAPATGTIGTGVGLAPLWTALGTVLHPTPSSTAPARSNQMKRTRFANIATTAQQELGIRNAVASEQQFWRGNAAGLGGFFYAARFIVELYPAATVRIFAGLTAAPATGVVISDTVLANTCGLWHDTTDPSTGSGAFSFVSKDATTASKTAIVLTNAIVAGNSYDFFMFCAPFGTTLYYRLDDIVNNVTYEGSKTTNLPVNTAFMQPQLAMSNGANGTVTTTAIGISGLYVESDL